MRIAAMASSSPHIATLFLSSSTFHSHLPLRTTTTLIPSLPSKKFILFRTPLEENNRLRPILLPARAAAEDVIISSETATEQLVSNPDAGVSTVISALLFFAFIGLSAITIGVIYLAVTDFLQNREKDKFEKEEAVKSKKKKKKKKVGRSRAGPRGFGQKVVQYEDDED